jgi:iron(III) transport system permease protein
MSTQDALATSRDAVIVGPRGLGAWRPRFDRRLIWLAPVVGLIGYLTIPPIFTVLYASLQSDFLADDSYFTLDHYVEHFTTARHLEVIFNSLIYAGGTMLLATCSGAVLAFLFARTDVPLRRHLFVLGMLPMLIPGLLNTFGYVFLMSPKVGLLNDVIGALTGLRPFDIYSLGGMIFVQGLHMTPIAFAILAGIFRGMDTTLEEAAAMAGASDLTVFRRITLPLAMPGLASAGLLIFVEAVASFEVPNLIGVPGGINVFVSEIFEALKRFPADMSGAASLSTLVMVLSTAGILVSARLGRQGERFATITGKGFRPHLLRLRRARVPAIAFVAAYVLFSVVLPIVVLAWVSLLPSYEPPSAQAFARLSFDNYVRLAGIPRILPSLANSLEVTLSAAAIVMAITSVAAYVVVKTRWPWRWLIETLAFIPIAVPGTILGVAVLFWYLMAPLPFSLYGTLALLVIGFVTLYLPHGMRFMIPAFMQVGREMEEAALMSGGSWRHAMQRVYAPLLAPSLMGGFLFIFVLAFREISASIFLYAQGTELFSLTLYDLWREGRFGPVSALGLVMICCFGIIVALGRRLVIDSGAAGGGPPK